MESVGIIGWQNEHALTDYPLSQYCGVYDLFLDASFIQFDGFVPVLVKLAIGREQLLLTIRFDQETLDVAITVAAGQGTRIYSNLVAGRYLGVVILGEGMNTLLATRQGETLSLDIPFASSTVTSIASSMGVFSIEGLFGDININTGDNPINRSIYFELQEPSDTVWNSVSLPPLNQELPAFLKTLNGMGPDNNGVWLLDSEIIKFSPGAGDASVQISVAGSSSSIGPVKTYQY